MEMQVDTRMQIDARVLEYEFDVRGQRYLQSMCLSIHDIKISLWSPNHEWLIIHDVSTGSCTSGTVWRIEPSLSRRDHREGRREPSGSSETLP